MSSPQATPSSLTTRGAARWPRFSQLGKRWALLRADNLVKNSFYLLAATGTQGVLGMAFWLLCAHLFPPAQVGVATALISACTLLAYASLLGVNSSIIRDLPTSDSPDDLMNSGIVLCTGVSVVLGTGYVLALPLLASKLAFVRHSAIYSIGFVAFVAMTTLILVTDAVFVARRQAKYNLAIDGFLQGVSKLVLPALLVGAGAYGIFAATGFASGLDVLASLLLIFLILGYRPRFRVRLSILRQAIGFSAANYFANLLNLMPTLVLPVAVLDELGTQPAAYYYVVFAIANLLNAIAYSTCQSLFAEGSHDDTDRRALMRRSARMLAIATIPAGIGVAALATTILSLFGRQYGQHAATTLVVLALGLVPVAFCTWSITLLRVTRRVAALMAASAVYAAATCGLAIWWARSGLVFVALAWVIGNVVTAVVACAELWKRRELLDWSPSDLPA